MKSACRCLNESDRAEMEVARVNTKRCNACGACLKTCPCDAIEIRIDESTGDGRAWIDRETCSGCGSCVVECPRKALTLESV